MKLIIIDAKKAVINAHIIVYCISKKNIIKNIKLKTYKNRLPKNIFAPSRSPIGR